MLCRNAIGHTGREETDPPRAKCLVQVLQAGFVSSLEFPYVAQFRGGME